MRRPLAGIFRSAQAIALFAVAWLAIFASVAPAAIPPAGQLISSRARAEFQLGGAAYSVFSNEISLSVLAVHGPVILPDGTVGAPAATVRAFAGEIVSVPFILGNAGNADDEFSLGVAYPAPSAFIPSAVRLYLDVDQDSIVDTGEPAVSSVGPLRPGEEVHLILQAVLPQGLTGGETTYLSPTACSVADPAACDRDNVVKIVARADTRVEVTLEADRSTALPGDTIGYTLRFTNAGERAATDVAVSDYIDMNGACIGTDFVPGVSSSANGRPQFYVSASDSWVDAPAPVERVNGVRVILDRLDPGENGSLSFRVRVRDGRDAGDIANSASSIFTGSDPRPIELASNEVFVRVGRVSALAIGPRGNPGAATGTPADRVVVMIGGDSMYTLWHEVENRGNFADSLQVAIADSAAIPDGWEYGFVDSTGAPLASSSSGAAILGTIPRGRSIVVGLRLGSTPEGFRRFHGRELRFNVDASSLFFESASDRVEDVLIKGAIPIISVKQSIREPTALVGDVLSFIVTVENMTEETVLDSVSIVENLSPGLGFAGGSEEPVKEGNVLRWAVGQLGPGGKHEIVFRARVKAGEEEGKLASSAWAFGVTDMAERASDGPSVASILIVEGIFTRRGLVLGGVFYDADGDGLWDAGEKGIRGVSVFIENGTYAVTDSLGFYSIPGIVEGRHVVRIDPASLPDSLVTGKGSYFGLGESGEELIDLAPSGERRVDFALARAPEGRGAGAAPAAAASSAAGKVLAKVKAPSTGPVTSAIDSLRAGASDSFSAPDRSGRALPTSPGTAAPPHTYDAIIIPSTHFAPGDAGIEGLPLDKIAGLSLWIMAHPGWKVFVEGHTDSIPMRSEKFPSNLELSLARARSVFQILRMNGISEGRMDYTGCGARSPVASNATEEGRALNRRVEIRVVPPADYAAGDPGLPVILRASEDSSYSLADSTGVCAAIVSPEEGSMFSSRGEIDVEVTSPLGSETELYANGLPVGKERIGLKRIDVGRGTFGMIFYGVKLEEGRNDLLVICREYGGKRNACVRHVYLAGKPARIVPEREAVRVNADGKSAPELVFLVSDEHGLPVRDGIFVTVVGPRDLIERCDANPQQAGVQVVTNGGRVVLTLPPSRETREARIKVSLDGMDAGSRVAYESSLRNWYLFGFGEGALGYGARSGSGSILGSQDAGHDGAFAEGKLAFYGQGEIRGGNLLTCAVDTRPIRDDMLFQRIEPEKYYPIYGDASELRYNVASRSGTYLRLDHRRYSAMLGDFKTDLATTEFTKYHRSFNGVTGEARFGRGSVKGFITRTDQVTFQEELPAEGTSGFYFLKHFPLVEGSERIRIEVRDRYRPEEIVRVDYKAINRDYDINYMDGSILFKEPVPAADENLNPVTIVASYECRNATEHNFIYGMRTEVAVRDSLAFGTTAVLEEEGVENSTLLGFDLAGALPRGLRIDGEYAHSEKFLLGGGNAFKMVLGGGEGSDLRWSAYYRDVGSDFFNPSFTGGKTELGSRKGGADLEWKVNKVFDVSAKGFQHSFRERDETQDFGAVLAKYTAGKLEGGIGFGGAGHRDTQEGGSRSALMLTSLLFKGAKTQAELQWDQILAGGETPEYPNRIQAKLEQKLWKNVSGVLRHEYRTGERSGTRHLTMLGLESNLTAGMTAYSRYQLEGAMSGERGEATMGIKNRFAMSKDLTGTVAVERVATVSGPKTDDYFSMSTGALYAPSRGDYRVKGDYEIRLEPDRRKHLAGLAALKKLGVQWSLIAKGDLWFSDEKHETDHVKESSMVGAALRPKTAPALDLLALVKSNYEKASPAHPDAVDKELLTSIEASYRLGRSWELEGKCAARWVRNSFRGFEAASSAFLYQAQVVRVIGGRWDVGLKARLVHQRETRTLGYGGGVELGRLVAKNVWVGAGYDFGGHEDRDTAINSFSTNGFHVGVRLKFDEKIMSYFNGAEEAGR